MERQISLRLPAALLAKIDGRARRRRRGRSDEIRDLLEAALRLPEGGGDALWIDRVRELIGGTAGGPADLSTNRRYLDDFGRGAR